MKSSEMSILLRFYFMRQNGNNAVMIVVQVVDFRCWYRCWCYFRIDDGDDDDGDNDDEDEYDDDGDNDNNDDDDDNDDSDNSDDDDDSAIESLFNPCLQFSRPQSHL